MSTPAEPVALRAAPAAPAAGRARRRGLMKPLTPVSPGARIALGIGFFVAFVALWSVVTFGGLVQKTFLADPWTMLDSGWTLLVEHGFAHDIGMTVFRVLGGFLIAALIAVPLGVAMGAYKPIEAFFELNAMSLAVVKGKTVAVETGVTGNGQRGGRVKPA